MKAPLIAECVANVECQVLEGPEQTGRDMFVLRGVRAWHNPANREKTFHARGDGTFIINGEQMDLRDRMTKWEHCI